VADLSPAAQAIDDAAYQAWVTRDDPRSIAAAAFRAAAAHLGSCNASTELLAIATELDLTL
jgi:hypothetical protein